jgi:hypothetical protein
MCIIIIKKKNVAVPSHEVLENCFINNSDGSGIAYVKNGSNKVIIEKGFLFFEEFIGRINELNFQSDDIVMYHFRLATHGLNNKENTHPFPLSRNITDLKKLYLETDIAIAHNGIFGSMPRNTENSDTQKFILFILSNLNVLENLNNEAFIELLRGYCGYSSKLAFLTGDKVFLIGNFIFDKKSGLIFSNDGYKNFKALLYSDTDFKNSQNSLVPISNKKTCELCGKKGKTKYNKLFDGRLCKKCKKEFLHYYYEDTKNESEV